MILLTAVTAPAQEQAAPFWPVMTADEMAVSPSPEVATLPAYRDPEVDLSSGRGTLSFGLLEWTVGNYPVRLGLTYRIGAFRTDELPGWIGLGWNLTGAGAVTRTVMGQPDEKLPMEVRTTTQANGSDCVDYISRLMDYKSDASRDRYSYSCPGGNGQFIIRDGEIVPLPRTNNRIEFIGETVDGVRDFRVTTPDGTRYEFTEREHISYQDTGPIDESFHPHDYTAVSSWMLSRIITAEGQDTIRFEYARMPKWTRAKSYFMQSVGISSLGSGSSDWTYMGPTPDEPTQQTTFEDPLILNRVISRTANAEIRHAVSGTGSRYNQPTMWINGMTLKNPYGETVSDVAFGHVTAGRRKLSKIEKRSADGTVVSSSSYFYHNENAQDLGDMFGYPNTAKGSTDAAVASVIDISTGKLNPRRDFNIDYAIAGAMDYHISPGGVETRYVYEPNRPETAQDDNIQTLWMIDTIITDIVRPSEPFEPVNPPEDDGGYDPSAPYTGEFIPEDIPVGVRIKSITSTDLATGRKRIREFSYACGMYNMDMSHIGHQEYIALSGKRVYDPGLSMAAVAYYNTVSTALSACRMPGQSAEGVSVFYGEVRESISGTDVVIPIKTIYRFDTSRCPLEYTKGARSMREEPDYEFRTLAFDCFPGGKPLFYRLMMGANAVRGYYNEHIGAVPELKETEVYEFRDGEYRIASRERRFYSTTDSMTETVDVFHEPLVRRYFNKTMFITRDIRSCYDVNTFQIDLKASSRQLDSIEYRCYFPDGSESLRTERNIYSGPDVTGTPEVIGPIPPGELKPQLPDGYEYVPDNMLTTSGKSAFPGDSIMICNRLRLPVVTIVREGGHRLERHVAYAATTDTEFFREAVGRGLQTLPVAEMWVMDGCDTLMRRYEYGRFAATGGVTLTRPTAIITGIPGQDAADVQRVTGGYSGSGRPLAVSQTARPTATYEWGCGGDLLTALTVGGGDDATGLRSEFDYEPLVGCTEIRFPSGRTATYGYSGGRLATVTDTYGKILTRHEYETFGETDGLTGRNRITTTTYPAGGSQGSVATRRFDGFGQAVAEVAEGAGNGGEDVATVVRYDALGRPVRQWLPLPLTLASAESDATLADALRRDVALTSAAMEHFGDTQAYSVMTYPEGSASELAATATLGGEAFAGHPSRQELTCSNPSDRERRVVRWSWDGTALSASGYYGAGELTAVRTEDGDGRVTYIFTDCLGRTVLQRSLADGGKQADTYTVSDPWGNPLIVLPPELSARLGETGQNLPGSAQMAELIDQYAFVYSYDHQLRVRSKKLPGCGAVRYAYDCDGLLAFTRDGNQEQQGRRSFMLYDRQGRVAVTGVCRDALDEAFWSAPSSANPSMTATMTGACGASGTLCGSGYSVGAELTDHLAEAQLLTATYYDDYSFIPQDKASDIRQHRPSTAVTSPRGLTTGSLTAQLVGNGIGRGLLSVTYYDREERPLVTVGETPTGELLVSTTAYNAGGQPTQTEYTLQKNGDALTTRATFGYDRHGRLTRTQQTLVPQTAASTAAAPTLPDGPISGPRPPRPPQPVTVAVSTSGYDALGRLSRTTTSRMPGMAGLTRTNEYDMHGWMVKWYCGFVEQQLAYADGAAPSYTGRISSKTTTYGGETRRYDYSYDMLGRLVGADYSGVDLANGGAALAADYSTAYSYDLQGNILTLTRQGLIAPDLYGQIDDLTATLRGNQLVGLRDDADDVLLESSLDLRGGDFGEDAFGYDRNGNQTRDMSRGVADVAYNVLNLPQRVEMEDGSAISYTYSASGAKLTETVISPDGIRVVKRGYLGPFEIRYDSVMVPQGIRPPLVPRDTVIHLGDGYLTMADTVFHAYIADYQGNITGVYNTRTAALEQFTDYYPYGMPHAMAVASSCGNRRKFGGKELTTDRGLNLYDFEARWYNSIFPRFLSQDLMQDVYQSTSSYTYCIGNPISFIDPDGMNIWEIDDKGNVINEIETTAYDMIVWVDSQGTPVVDENGQSLSIQLPYGTILGVQPDISWIDDDGICQHMTIFYLKDQESAKNFFEKASSEYATKVEWSHTEFVFKRQSLIAVGNAHDTNKTFQANHLLNKGSIINYDAHYHPAGGDPSPGDKDASYKILSRNPKAKVKLYRNGKYEDVPPEKRDP